ncbi:PREDICTED: uncharacterized protein LOC104709234 [Camelina sativa]|uniref:Uncharacterized protein LOC104709234 n=1 Tax=Camelina sativa TaxID=90675 RepID=A0ABM0TCH6_CAMSA|nr:PREDICTED: uncharacterized protein LOC104709234 [Camelina sativa]
MGITLHATVAEALSHRQQPHIVEHLNQFETALANIRSRGLVEEADVVLWKGKGGQFKTKFTTKETWENTRHPRQRVSWVAEVWFSHATPKFSFIVWLATLNRLATGDRMQHWHAQVDISCSLCHAPLETRNHLFFSCPYSTAVWTGLTSKLLAHQFSTDWTTNLALLTDTSLEKTTLFLPRYAFQASIHTLWKRRNNRRHGEPSVLPALFLKHLYSLIRNRLLSLPTNRDHLDYMAKWLATR